jgi:sugar/nucleoside kinase (ribokinase family)
MGSHDATGGDTGGMPAAPQVLTVGRSGVDLYPEQRGAPLSAVTTFARSPGGTATNVAVGATRLGHRSAVLTKVGPDEFGVFVREALAGFGVDAIHVGTVAEYGHAAGAIVVAQLACADAIPTIEELDAMVAGHWVSP